MNQGKGTFDSAHVHKHKQYCCLSQKNIEEEQEEKIQVNKINANIQMEFRKK